MRRLLITIFYALLAACCTDAGVSRYEPGGPHQISVYSGGVVIGEWRTTGGVRRDGTSEGYVFTDAATGQMVRVSGEVVITLARQDTAVPRDSRLTPR